MKLYELADQYKTIAELLDSDFAEGQNETQALQSALDEISDSMQDKLDNIAKLIMSKKAEAEAIQAEQNRLSKRGKKLDSDIQWLKEYVEYHMEATGQEKIKTALFSFNIQNNPPSVDVMEPEKIPGKYWLQQDPKLDKRTILEDLKAGQTVDGCGIMQSRGLRIR